MKNYYPLLVFMLFYNFGFSQTQKEHKNKTYHNEKGRLFVNKHEPMYLFLGTNPDGENIQRLKSESTKEYANPFYFDTEGYNTVRTPSKVDTITRKVVLPAGDIIFEVYADGLAPVSTSKFLAAPNFFKDGVLYYGKNLEIAISTFDEMSGVESLFFSLDGVAYTKYASLLKITDEKAYTVAYYGVDNVGNTEKVKTKKFALDITAPVVDWNMEGEISGNYISGRSKIRLTAKDNLTGVRNIYYQFGEGKRLNYNFPISTGFLKEGYHKIKFWADDKVLNMSDFSDDIKSDFIIDKTAPVVSSKILNDKYIGKFVYVSERSQLEITAEDAQSGVDQIKYGFNDGVIKTVYKSPVSFIKEQGPQSVRYRAFDKVSNKSSVTTTSVFLDNRAPVSGIDYSGPEFFARDTLFINNKTKVKLFSKDNASGIKQIAYTVNGNEAVYDTIFTIENEGFNKIDFYATDNVNNAEIIKSSEVVVDNIGPEIYVNFSIKPIRIEEKSGEKINVYPPYVKLYLGATDKQCGTNKIYYQIDGGKKQNYTSSNSLSNIAMFNSEASHQVLITAYDKLDNEVTKLVKFVVAEK